MGSPGIDESEEKRLEDFASNSDIIPLDTFLSKSTIQLKRQIRIKLPDAVIAATALANNLILITRNTNDFKNVKGLKLLNPREI